MAVVAAEACIPEPVQKDPGAEETASRYCHLF